MTAEELAKLLNADILSKGESEIHISGCMVCDVMSRTIADGFHGMAWITCNGGVNALAVSVMTGASCLVLSDGTDMDAQTLSRAQTERIWVIGSSESAFTLAGRLYEAGLRAGKRGGET